MKPLDQVGPEAWASFQLGQAWASLEAAAQNLKRAGHSTAADEARQLAERVFQIQRRTFGDRDAG